MHDLHIARKLGVYRALYRINQSFSNILTHCNELRELKILKPNTARRYQSLIQELQAEMNRGLANRIETTESRVHSRLLRARKAEEDKIPHAARRRGSVAKGHGPSYSRKSTR